MMKKGLFSVGLGIVALSFVFCSNTFADSNATDEVTITVPVSCSMTSAVGTTHSATVDLGTYEDEIGETTFNVLCNDASGFSVYAVGYSDDTYGNTTMVPSTLTAANGIATGTATSGNTSNWAMKLTAVSGTYTPTFTTGYNAYHAVPETYTKVATLSSNTDATVGSSFKSTYAVYISQAQPADSYTGKVKYTVVHPGNEVPAVETVEQVIYMQDFASLSPDELLAVRNSMEDDKTYLIVDSRDNRTYDISKMEDGNIWMTENLDLGREPLTYDLTSENTNLSTTVTAETFNSWKKTSGSATNDAGEYISNNGTDAASGTPYATLYNYYAATAGTISGSTNSNNAEYDICPAGWRLPTGGSAGEFKALHTEYHSSAEMRAPVADGGAAFALAGMFSNSSPNDRGSNGYYWSSVRNSDTKMYILYVYTSSINSTSSYIRSSGLSIRCVLKERTMQTVSSWGDEVQAGQEVLAKDARDGKYYSVARLADGNLWMTQNLDFNIDSTKTYTPANTDIPANWTPSVSTYQSEDTTWNGEFYSPESYDPGELYYNLENIDYSINGEGDPPELFVDTGDYHSHLGNYYNWAAAIATNDSTSYVGSGNLVDRSICPAGWTLPRPGYGDDSFYGLATAYHTTWGQYGAILSGDLNLWEAPVYFLQYGFWHGEFSNVGGDGSFWTSVSGSNDASYALTLSIGPWGNYIYPAVGESQVYLMYGFSVRCIARPVSSTVTFTAP